MDAAAQTNTDYQAFLKLMTEQMKNQDPLAPLDATQFVTQLAQFSQVEQSVQTNEKLDDVSQAISSLASQAGTSLLGRSVEVEDRIVKLDAGEATARLSIDGSPAETSYLIVDENGDVVRTQPFTYTGPGQTVTWDGKSDDGTDLSDGFYSMEIIAADSDGRPLDGYVFTTHEVAEVVQSNGSTSLVLDTGRTLDMRADMRIF